MRRGIKSERVVVYAVGRAGIGHAMRARRLAEHLVRGGTRNVDVVVVTGHVDAAAMLVEGRQVSVRVPDATVKLLEQRMQVPMSLEAVRDARQALVDILEDVSPTVVVSTSPSGLHGEFRDAMSHVRGSCRSVLALRDIYYPPLYSGTYKTLDERFDEILIAGPPDLSQWTPPMVRNHGGPPVTHVGYLSPLDRLPVPNGRPHTPVVRCQVGGGRDGAETVLAVVEAFTEVRPTAAKLHIDLGPFFPTKALQRLRAHTVDGLEITTWSPSDQSTTRPTAVISMAGYNSAVEAAWTGVPTLLWPRHDENDFEQEIRAAYFAKRFGTITVHDGLVRSLRRWIEHQIDAEQSDLRDIARPDFFADPSLVAARVLGGEASSSEGMRMSEVDGPAGSHCPRDIAP